MKWLKRILLVVALLTLIAGGVAYWLFSQATYVPDWYAEELAAAPAPGATAPDSAPVWQDAPGAAPGKRKELRNFHRRAAKQDPTVGKVIKASRASFEDGRLEMGVVADLRQLPHDKLAAGQRELFEKVRASFPSATDREIYIGVEDPAPALRGGQIGLGPQARVRIGKLAYDLDAAAAKLGMSPAALRAQFEQQLRGLGVTAPSP